MNTFRVRIPGWRATAETCCQEVREVRELQTYRHAHSPHRCLASTNVLTHLLYPVFANSYSRSRAIQAQAGLWITGCIGRLHIQAHDIYSYDVLSCRCGLLIWWASKLRSSPVDPTGPWCHTYTKQCKSGYFRPCIQEQLDTGNATLALLRKHTLAVSSKAR